MLEDPHKSYQAPQRVTGHDHLDNRLIFPRRKKVIDGGGPRRHLEGRWVEGRCWFSLLPARAGVAGTGQVGQWVISKEFNAAMLAEAAYKPEGFTYAPSDMLYWQHGHSTERDFIYVTTQHLRADLSRSTAG